MNNTLADFGPTLACVRINTAVEFLEILPVSVTSYKDDESKHLNYSQGHVENCCDLVALRMAARNALQQ